MLYLHTFRSCFNEIPEIQYQKGVQMRIFILKDEQKNLCIDV